MILKEWIDNGEYYNQSDDLDCYCYLDGIIEIPTLHYDSDIDYEGEDHNAFDYDYDDVSFDVEDYSADEKMTETIIEKIEDDIVDEIVEYILCETALWELLPDNPKTYTYEIKVEISFYLNNIIVHEETAQDPDTDLYSWIEVDNWDIDNISIDKAELLN